MQSKTIPLSGAEEARQNHAAAQPPHMENYPLDPIGAADAGRQAETGPPETDQPRHGALEAVKLLNAGRMLAAQYMLHGLSASEAAYRASSDLAKGYYPISGLNKMIRPIDYMKSDPLDLLRRRRDLPGLAPSGPEAGQNAVNRPGGLSASGKPVGLGGQYAQAGLTPRAGQTDAPGAYPAARTDVPAETPAEAPADAQADAQDKETMGMMRAGESQDGPESHKPWSERLFSPAPASERDKAERDAQLGDRYAGQFGLDADEAMTRLPELKERDLQEKMRQNATLRNYVLASPENAALALEDPHLFNARAEMVDDLQCLAQESITQYGLDDPAILQADFDQCTLEEKKRITKKLVAAHTLMLGYSLGTMAQAVKEDAKREPWNLRSTLERALPMQMRLLDSLAEEASEAAATQQATVQGYSLGSMVQAVKEDAKREPWSFRPALERALPVQTYLVDNLLEEGADGTMFITALGKDFGSGAVKAGAHIIGGLEAALDGEHDVNRLMYMTGRYYPYDLNWSVDTTSLKEAKQSLMEVSKNIKTDPNAFAHKPGKNAALGVAEALGEMLPTAAASAVNPGLGLLVNSMQTTGEVYDNLLASGMSKEEASHKAMMTGVLSTGIGLGVEKLIPLGVKRVVADKLVSADSLVGKAFGGMHAMTEKTNFIPRVLGKKAVKIATNEVEGKVADTVSSAAQKSDEKTTE